MRRQAGGGEAFETLQRFDSLPLKPSLLKALTDEFHYETMSAPQATALPVALEGKDILLRSSTGSGKTLTFLLAALQNHLSSSRHAAGELGVLVLTPLREVALQTQREASRLLTHLPTRGAQVVIGGTDARAERRAMSQKPCDVLVATPGRLLDHLAQSQGSPTTKALVARLKSVHTVVIDEADRMLDPGFAPAVRKIFTQLPDRMHRHTIMVSATIDASVKASAKDLLRPDFVSLSTVSNASADAGRLTVNERIDLRLMQVDPGHILFALESALTQQPPKKTLVFMPASNWASFATQLLRAAGHTQVEEFHGKLNQNQRTRTIQKFTKDPKGVLIASDAAARGLDIADIDRVIQVGITDVTGFVQRSGRTGRAGRAGEALWLLGSDEAPGLLKEFALAKVPLKELEKPLAVQPSDAMVKAVAAVPKAPQLRRAAVAAFKGTLGTYAAPRKRMGWDAQGVVDAVKARFAQVGLADAPAMDPKTLKKMNLQAAVLK